MSTVFPGAIDAFANPVGTDLLENASAALDHDFQHASANDAIEALEAKVGIDGSAVTTSHDYKLSGITGTDKALSSGSGAGAQTITDLTLVDPIFTLGGDATGDMFYRNSGGVITRLPIGTAGQIIQAGASGIPEYVANPAASTASYSVSGVSTIDAGVRFYAADAGANDTYAITLSPAPDAYVTGQTFRFKANTANTGAATLNVNSLGAKTIVKGVNTTLADGDIAAGQLCTVIYDGTNFVLQSPVSTALTPTNYGLFKNGITSRTSVAGSGTENIAHGLGQIPKKVRLSSGMFTNSTNYAKSVGVYNGTTMSIFYDWHGSSGSPTMATDTTNVIYLEDSGGGKWTATVTFDATNIIVVWTKTGTPATAQVMWEAEA